MFLQNSNINNNLIICIGFVTVMYMILVADLLIDIDSMMIDLAIVIGVNMSRLLLYYTQLQIILKGLISISY